MLIDLGLRSLVQINQHFRLGDTITLPESISAITSIDNASEVTPESVQLSAAAVDAIWQSVVDVYQTGTHPAISLCFRHRGEIVLNRAIGHASGNGPHQDNHATKVLMQANTPGCYYSGSKAVTAFLIHLLSEDKLLNLHDPVSLHLPEFGCNGKHKITIHQVLTHRSGVSGLPANTPVTTMADEAEVWQLICATKPSNRHQDKLAYHALTGGYILARLIAKVSGMNINQFLHERVRKPMQMQYFSYGVKPKQAEQLATNYGTGIRPMYPISRMLERALGSSLTRVIEVSNSSLFHQAVIPSANLFGTAEEMGRFYQMLLNDGIWQGQRICQPETVQSLLQEHASMQFDRTLMAPMHYSAGLMLGADPIGMWGFNSGQAFGHVGLINKLFWADPQRDISVSLFTTGIPFIASHLPALMNFIHQINRHCPHNESA